jgi:hypothetical protein
VNYACCICSQLIEQDAKGNILLGGVTQHPRRAAWEWGPEPLHETCQPALITPFDGMADYKLTWHHVQAEKTAGFSGAPSRS